VPKVDKDYSLYRTYVIFRTLGLRHLVVVNVHNHVVGIITRKDLMPFRMQERLEVLLEQTTTLNADTEFELNGDVPKASMDSGKGSSYSNNKVHRVRSSDAISNQSSEISLPALTRSSSMKKVSLNEKEDDANSVRSIHSIRSFSSAATTSVEDGDPSQSDGIASTPIVVTVSPPDEDEPDPEART